METKPGYKTTEFYVTVLAALVGLAAASGMIDPESTSIWIKAFGMAQTALVTMGYSIARGLTKAGIKP